jgi:DNA-binding NarL/FixJ family response regulator
LVLQITPEERDMLLLLANGRSTHELAGRFGVSDRVVEAALAALYARMGATDRIEAVATAFRRGLLTAG